MSLLKIVINTTNHLKPVLLKIFPHELLRIMKGRVIKKSHQKLLKVTLKPFDRKRFQDGVNLIGNIKADTGLGQSCRLVAAELDKSSIPYSVYQYEQLGIMSSTDMQFAGKISCELPYNINLIHINPHELGLAFQQLGHSVWDGHYNIGFWLWELEEFPEEWTPCFRCLDEIWTPSEFISQAVRKKTSLPVKTVPYHVETRMDQVYERTEFGLPDDMFLFLMMYDRTSMTERKNPEAVIQAYKKAFTRQDKAGLVIKINNCTHEEINVLKKSLEDYPNVFFISQIMDRSHVNSLIRCVDAVVSLHRAEGFGLVLAEAMMLGTPTIATNWSSNTEFMTSDTSCLVDCQLVELKKDLGLFKKGNRWAEPDVEQAADYMRCLYHDPKYAHEMAERAKAYIEERLSMKQIVGIIEERIGEIYEAAIKEGN